MSLTAHRPRPKAPKPPPPQTDRSRDGRSFNFWTSDEIGDAFDAYCKSLRYEPKMKQVMEQALTEFLEREGFWPPTPPPRVARPD